MKFISKTEKDTFNFSKKLAKNLKGGELISLIGDLGAGKTVFSQGIASGLGIKERVNSPTFVVMKVYDVNDNKVKVFCHIDAYRLSSFAELEAIGVSDYLGQDDVVTVIEWADKVSDGLPDNVMRYKLSHADNERTIEEV